MNTHRLTAGAVSAADESGARGASGAIAEFALAAEACSADTCLRSESSWPRSTRASAAKVSPTKRRSATVKATKSVRFEPTFSTSWGMIAPGTVMDVWKTPLFQDVTRALMLRGVVIEYFDGNLETAEQHYNEALDIYRKTGDKLSIG